MKCLIILFIQLRIFNSGSQPISPLAKQWQTYFLRNYHPRTQLFTTQRRRKNCASLSTTSCFHFRLRLVDPTTIQRDILLQLFNHLHPFVLRRRVTIGQGEQRKATIPHSTINLKHVITCETCRTSSCLISTTTSGSTHFSLQPVQ